MCRHEGLVHRLGESKDTERRACASSVPSPRGPCLGCIK